MSQLPGRMHADEVLIDAGAAAALIAAQFPALAELPVTPVQSSGTDNAIFRVGDALSARLPRLPDAALRIEKEARWLPQIAPHLPITVPVPIATGEPGEGYPWAWSIAPWLEGQTATSTDFDQPAMARSLAGFARALQQIDASDGPLPGPHNSGRGAPLAERDSAFRRNLALLADDVDTERLAQVWQDCLAAPSYDGPSRWLHGDLQPENLLVMEGKLAGVIDFGCLGAGDPACDLMPAWTLFDASARGAFRDEMAAGDAEWTRGRGWALSFAVIALPYYRETNPVLAAIARRTIERILEEAAGQAGRQRNR